MFSPGQYAPLKYGSVVNPMVLFVCSLLLCLFSKENAGSAAKITLSPIPYFLSNNSLD